MTSGRPAAASEQVVERGVGEEEPDQRAVGRDLRRQARRLPAPHQHDRPLRRGEEGPLGGREDRRAAPAAARSATMTASGFSSRRLRSRSVRTAAAEVASQARWKPPIPFTATMRPAASASAASARSGRRLGTGAPPRARAARPAGRRPGRRSARRGSAGRRGRRTRAAQAGHMREGGHGGGRPVVGHVADDGEARAAVGAVRERIAKATVGRVADLAQAGRRRWRGRAGWRPAARSAPPLSSMTKPAASSGAISSERKEVDPRRRGPSGAEPRLERVERGPAGRRPPPSPRPRRSGPGPPTPQSRASR